MNIKNFHFDNFYTDSIKNWVESEFCEEDKNRKFDSEDVAKIILAYMNFQECYKVFEDRWIYLSSLA